MEKVSDFTVRRLSHYYRILGDLEQSGASVVSSARLAELGGVTPAQVRKDLSCFGSFGTRGLGYGVSDLKKRIQAILGLDREWALALFGAGSLGHALFFFQGFRDDRFIFTHVFDADPAKAGLKWEHAEIRPFARAEEDLRARPVDIGVIATPKEAAQTVVDLLVRLGVKGVLNFAPKQLAVPEDVRPRNVNLAVAMESLSYYLSA